jgi:hypothetical protein
LRSVLWVLPPTDWLRAAQPYLSRQHLVTAQFAPVLLYALLSVAVIFAAGVFIFSRREFTGEG